MENYLRSVEDRVVVLEELLADDEVDARGSTVSDPGVVGAAGETKVGVLGSGDQILGGGQVEGRAADGERERGGGLAIELREAGEDVGSASTAGEERAVRGGRNVDKGCAGVDDGRQA